MTFDGEAFGKEIVALVKGFLERKVAELEKKLDELEKRDIRTVKNLLIDREGCLVATMSDGETENIGPVCGRDGTDGKDGTDAKQVEELVEDDALTISALLRKEIGEKLIEMPPLDWTRLSAVANPVNVTVENHLPKRGIEKTVVTKHDERGRVIEFERREI